MRRVVALAAALGAACFLVWGLGEAGFWWGAARWALKTAGPAAGAGALVTLRAVGWAGLGYAAVGALIGLAWGVILGLALWRRPDRAAPGALLPLRVLCSILALGALVGWVASDLALSRHPETAQNPGWFLRVPLAVRLSTYALLCWGLHRLWLLLGDWITRPRATRWIRSRRTRRGLGATLVLTTLVLLLVPHPAPPPVERAAPPRPKAPSGAPNVVLIVLDTVRPDHTSLYGYARPTTPNLLALAGDGTVFERAYSTSSWTLPSHASLFTGLYPSEHGATGEHFWLDDARTTLAERLRALGYRTWAASGNAMVGPTSNLDQGFDRFLESWRSGTWTVLSLPRALARLAGYEPDEGARESTRAVTGWIHDAGDGSPFFLFVNLIEAHAPYAPPEPFRSRFLEGRQPPDVDVYGNRFLDYMLGTVDVSDAELDGLRRLYDGEIAYVDSRVGEIVAALRRSGAWDRTLLIVAADHGENIGEHRLMDHQLCVYETLTRIPLLAIGPGFPRGARVPELVQLHDVFATVLAAAGDREDPSSERSPRDLAAIARGEIPGRRFAVSEYHRPVAVLKMLAKKLALSGREAGPALARFDRTLRALVRGSWKLVGGSDGRNELYDLAADPGETHDLAGQGHGEEQALAEQLRDWVSSLDSAQGGGGEGALHTDEQSRERLRALGYID